LRAIHTQAPRKAFLDRINAELELVQNHLSELDRTNDQTKAKADVATPIKENPKYAFDTGSSAPVKFPRRRPGPLDLSSPVKPNIPAALPSALATARFIDDLSRVPYPENIQSPEVELNINAKDGKFR
jgi:translation initiation factor 4G